MEIKDAFIKSGWVVPTKSDITCLGNKRLNKGINAQGKLGRLISRLFGHGNVEATVGNKKVYLNIDSCYNFISSHHDAIKFDKKTFRKLPPEEILTEVQKVFSYQMINGISTPEPTIQNPLPRSNGVSTPNPQAPAKPTIKPAVPAKPSEPIIQNGPAAFDLQSEIKKMTNIASHWDENPLDLEDVGMLDVATGKIKNFDSTLQNLYQTFESLPKKARKEQFGTLQLRKNNGAIEFGVTGKRWIKQKELKL